MEGYIKDDKKDGLSTSWYENGNKQLETNNKDGELDGVSTLWFDNGQKKAEVTFKKGKILSEKKWNEDGSTNQK